MEMRSHGIVPGVIQVPHSGQPIIQMRDAQPSGGYPKFGTVIEADLWRLGQAPIGSRVRFVETTWDEAVAALDEIRRLARQGAAHGGPASQRAAAAADDESRSTQSRQLAAWLAGTDIGLLELRTPDGVLRLGRDGARRRDRAASMRATTRSRAGAAAAPRSPRAVGRRLPARATRCTTRRWRAIGARVRAGQAARPAADRPAAAAGARAARRRGGRPWSRTARRSATARRWSTSHRLTTRRTTMDIDLNADLGEGFGPWRMGEDEALLELVSSANVACGFHAGDPVIMDRTVRTGAGPRRRRRRACRLSRPAGLRAPADADRSRGAGRHRASTSSARWPASRAPPATA